MCFCSCCRRCEDSALVGALVSARTIAFDHACLSPCSTTTIVRRRTCGCQVSIYQPEMVLLDLADLAAFRTDPATALVVRWQMDVDGGIFEAVAFTIAGEVLARCRFVLEPGQKVTVEDLRKICIEGAVVKGVLTSRSQPVRMFLDGEILCELPETGIIWSHWASFCPAKVRLSQKTNLERLRWARWITALRDGSASLDADPTHLA